MRARDALTGPAQGPRPGRVSLLEADADLLRHVAAEEVPHAARAL